MKTNRVTKTMIAALAMLAVVMVAVPVSQAAPAAVVAAATGLSAVEAEDLAYMREEEKLARDVYLTLNEQWNWAVFDNVAASESQHMESVAVLLERYGAADPASGNGTGEFTNPALQSLYDRLIAQGSQSLADALQVGATIEEVDIVDLETRTARTDHPDIAQVYENLLRGSRNHLRAFVSNREQQTGEEYVPQYLSLEEYQSIVDSSVERGGPGAGGGQGRGRGR